MSPLPKATFERATRAANDMSHPKPTVADNFGLISEHHLVNGNSNETNESSQSSRSGSTIVNGGGVPHTDSSAHLDHSNLVKESERLKTFDRWPVRFLSPRVMTKAGFYYTKERDTVRCAFCGIEIGQWEMGDNPMADHRRWSPDCRFVRNPPANNISIEEENAPSTRPPACGPFAAGVDVCGPFQAFGEETSGTSTNAPIPTERFLALLENLGYQKSRAPSFPNYASYSARLRSYDTWPISLKLKPNVLSDAGFFYTGKGDQTVCFHCGGGLKDWEETDEPWVEHARWFSKCLFVLLTKGKEFVDQVNGLKPKESVPRSSSCAEEATTSASTDRIERPLTKSSTEESRNPSCSKKLDNDSPTPEDGRLCKICFTEEMGVVFLPCGHIVACTKCAVSLTTCAVCREPVTATFRAFLS